jgi:hypothetical protein
MQLRALAAFFLLNLATFSLIIVVTLMLIPEAHCVKVLDSTCLTFSMVIFVAPMSAIISY